MNTGKGGHLLNDKAGLFIISRERFTGSDAF
ncbi:hypothetical protein QFZ51_003910 [Chitinophaga sp. W3I9]